MLIFLKQRLVFLAVPKAGSTAFETAYRPLASIDVKGPPRDRHMNARRYRKTFAPFLKRVWSAEPETFAILREPRERLESWYRYRLIDGRAKSTEGLNFDEFVQAVLSDDPPEPAQIGAQDKFVCDKDGTVLVNHLFAIERPAPLHDFLTDRFGSDVEIAPRNASPDADVSLSAETEGLLFELRAEEFALYDKVLAAGHYQTGATEG